MSSKQPISSQPPSSASTSANIHNVYANLKEHILPDLRIHAQFIDEALQAILHTLLFVRAPADVRPKDVSCENLAPIIYATCGLADIESIVSATIDLLKKSLVISSSGQNLRGEITLSFYQRKENRGWLYSNTEHVYFERWRLPITVLDFQNSSISPSSGSGKSSSLMASTMLTNANNTSASTSSQRRHSTGGTSTTPGIGYFQGAAIGGGLISEHEESSSGPSVDPVKAYLQAYDLVTKSVMYILETANTTTTQVPAIMYFFKLDVSDAIELRQTPAFNHSGSNMTTGKSSPMVSSTSHRRA